MKTDSEKTKENNKKLIQTYPWLSIHRIWKDDDTYEISDEEDYSYTILDEMPDGWKKAFGMMMVEEIDEELKKQGKVNFYYVFEIKEKYGSLRWYDNGDKKIQEIVDKYEVISRNTCLICGKPDTPVRIDGYVWPECRECYESDEYNHLPYEEVISQEDSKIPDSYTIKTWTDEKQKKIDISETVKKLRKNFN